MRQIQSYAASVQPIKKFGFRPTLLSTISSYYYSTGKLKLQATLKVQFVIVSVSKNMFSSGNQYQFLKYLSINGWFWNETYNCKPYCSTRHWDYFFVVWGFLIFLAKRFVVIITSFAVMSRSNYFDLYAGFAGTTDTICVWLCSMFPQKNMFTIHLHLLLWSTRRSTDYDEMLFNQSILLCYLCCSTLINCTHT